MNINNLLSKLKVLGIEVVYHNDNSVIYKRKDEYVLSCIVDNKTLHRQYSSIRVELNETRFICISTGLIEVLDNRFNTIIRLQNETVVGIINKDVMITKNAYYSCVRMHDLNNGAVFFDKNIIKLEVYPIDETSAMLVYSEYLGTRNICRLDLKNKKNRVVSCVNNMTDTIIICNNRYCVRDNTELKIRVYDLRGKLKLVIRNSNFVRDGQILKIMSFNREIVAYELIDKMK